MKRRLGIAGFVATLVAAALAGCVGGERGPIRIGVMLPLTGPDAVDSKLPLEWARENVNGAGGIDGRRIDFVYKDTGRLAPAGVARDFARDSSITAVIGPADSENARDLVSGFFDHHKVIVSPSATSADLFRAFASYRPQYFWRTAESDVAQTRKLLDLAVEGGAHSAALVAGDSPYGDSFFDSFGFFATESGLDVKKTIRFDQAAEPCDRYMNDALSSGAAVVLAVPDHADQAACMARAWRAHGSKPRMIFSDAAQDPSLIPTLGPDAEGLEGSGFAPDPNNGFAQAFETRFHQPPTPYAANTYDAVALIALGLARSGGEGGADLADALMKVTDGKGPKTSWDAAGVTHALKLFDAGKTAYVQGAVGPWDFDTDDGLELVASTYEHWHIQGSQFSVDRYLSTRDAPTAQADQSAARVRSSPSRARANLGGSYTPGPKTGTWALLVAASDGWDNYRHQADVLAQYERLRAGGVAPDHIVVVSADDLAHDRRNPRQGEVNYTVGGPNLDRDVHADYRLEGMTADRLLAVLSGHESPDTPKVIRSGPGDDVFVFFAGHGLADGIFLGAGESTPPPNPALVALTPDALNRTVNAMAARGQYRRMLIAVEACEGGVFGDALNAPGALALTAANDAENSLSTNYDAKARTWLADEFSYHLWRAETTRANESVLDVYQHLYRDVRGSHVTASGPSFGNAADVRLGEFFS